MNDKNKIMSLLMGFGLPSYSDYKDLILDEKVNDCLIKAYFSMLANNQEDRDKYYNEFEIRYNELNDEQKELANIELAKVLNIEYKPKVKKKER
ncbi:MAG: hypothetical protein IJD92_01560 [Bacilli bacterium]|nr:hypothetical protein [Bacilli bacterium]